MRALHLALILFTGLALGLGFGCDPSARDCQEGTEGCDCTSDNKCVSGLQCLSAHCVDPNWTPERRSDSGDASKGALDNVGACEDWISTAGCGDFDFSASVDCSVYGGLDCDIADYFNCLSDNTQCADGIPNTSGWNECVNLAQCA